MKKRPVKLRLIVITGAMLMMLAGYEFYTDRLIAAAAVYVFAGISSISMLRKPALSDSRVLLYSSFMQAGLCLVNAAVLFEAGRKGLPYAWLLAGLVSSGMAWKNRAALTEKPASGT